MKNNKLQYLLKYKVKLAKAKERYILAKWKYLLNNMKKTKKEERK